MKNWKAKATHIEGDQAMQPEWNDNAPMCADSCPYHDGKRCEVMGVKPSYICEPTVWNMCEMLDEANR